MRRASKRRRTGCATCRVRHIKCDEKKPICNNCEKRNLDCKQTDIIVPCLPPRSTTATKTLPPAPPPPLIQPPPSPYSDPAPGSTWEVVQQSQSTFPPPAAPWPPITPSSPTPPSTTKTTNDDCTTTTLLRIYQHGIGAWMDVMDHSHRYQRAVLRLALSSPLLLHALCALAAKQMSLVSPHRHHHAAFPSSTAAAAPPSLWEPLAARYYGESLRLLIAALAEDTTTTTTTGDAQSTRKKKRREETLTATILLGSYELLAAPSADYARHLRGAQTLIRAGGIDFGSASALEDAGLWVFARQDLAMAVAGRRGLLWPVERWGEMRWSVEEGGGGSENMEEEDWWGKKVLWLLARVVECVFGDADARGEEPVEGLLRELEGWYEGLPESFEGLRLKGALAEGLDEVWFPIDSAATALLYYYMATIILLEERSRRAAETSYPEQIRESARSIASICLSKGISDGNLVVAINPLSYAIKHTTSAVIRNKMWALLDDIENRLGFHTRGTLEALEHVA